MDGDLKDDEKVSMTNNEVNKAIEDGHKVASANK
jgi:hypothetical protein